jgi:hypothetical protein
LVVRLGPGGFRVTWLGLGLGGRRLGRGRFRVSPPGLGRAPWGWGDAGGGWPRSALDPAPAGSLSARLPGNLSRTWLDGRRGGGRARAVPGNPPRTRLPGNLPRAWLPGNHARRGARRGARNSRAAGPSGAVSWFSQARRTRPFVGNPKRTPEPARPGTAPKQGPRARKKGAWGGPAAGSRVTWPQLGETAGWRPPLGAGAVSRGAVAAGGEGAGPAFG